jgi:autotransporter-associated beta strand protein
VAGISQSSKNRYTIMKNPSSTTRRCLFSQASLLGTALSFALGLLLPASLQAAPVATKFTTSGTFTPPAGVSEITVECWGGGGAGGSAQKTSANAGGGGGGGGAYAKKVIQVTPEVEYTVTIPEGTTALTSGFAAGDRADGASVTFTGDLDSVTANGGQGGACAVDNTGAGGSGGAVGSGDAVHEGGDGKSNTPTNGGPGGAGASDLTAGNDATAGSSTAGATTLGSDANHNGGAGGGGRTAANNGIAGTAAGGGGGGAKVTAAGTRTGGTGGMGQIIITYNVALANAKANNTLSLNNPSSWTTSVPGAAELAIWDDTVNGPNTTVLGANLTFGGIQILNPGGLVTINSGNTLTLGAAINDIDLATATNDLTLNCDLLLGADNTWIASSVRTLTITGDVSGPYAVTKSGNGTVLLSGDNSYGDITTVSAGVLTIESANALGNTAGDTQVANSAGLLLQGGISFAAEDLYLTSGTATTAMLRSVSGDNTWNGDIYTTGAAAAVRISSELDELTLAGAINGGGPQVVLQGEGDILVSGKVTGSSPLTSSNLNNLGATGTTLGTRTISNPSNDFTGKINVNGGTLVLNGVGTSGAATNEVSVGALAATNSGRLDLGGFSHSVGPVSINSAPPAGDAISNGSLTGTSYAATNGSGTTIVSANLLVNASAGFTKSGAGAVVLTGSNTYTGDTIVNAGSLRVNSPGSLAAASAVTVNGTSTLGGDGTIGGNVTVTATAKLAPGDTAVVGTLTIGGNLDISAPAADAGILTYQLDTSAASDQIVTGTLTIGPGGGPGALGFSDFVFENLAGFGGGTYKLITTTGGITGLLDEADLTGTINSLNVSLQITGNDLELVVESDSEDFDSWASSQVPPVTGGPNGDSDNDGVPNLVEYALVDGGERGVVAGNTITFTKRGAPYGGDITYAIETSETLATGSWTIAVSDVPENLSIAYSFTPSTPPKEFARLKVTRIP